MENDESLVDDWFEVLATDLDMKKSTWNTLGSVPLDQLEPDLEINQCSLCQKSFVEVKNLLQHLQNTHDDNPYINHNKYLIFHCAKCQFIFEDFTDLQIHLNVIHGKCPKCHDISSHHTCSTCRTRYWMAEWNRVEITDFQTKKKCLPNLTPVSGAKKSSRILMKRSKDHSHTERQRRLELKQLTLSLAQAIGFDASEYSLGQKRVLEQATSHIRQLETRVQQLEATKRELEERNQLLMTKYLLLSESCGPVSDHEPLCLIITDDDDNDNQNPDCSDIEDEETIFIIEDDEKIDMVSQ